MNKPTPAFNSLSNQPRTPLNASITPLQPMPNLSRQCGGAAMWIKRDDMTGLAFGGNKVRQLEFYMGQAVAQGADTVLVTSAVQSNFVRMTIAAANKLGMQAHVQLEQRVATDDPLYHNSGNVLLDRMMGATIHNYPVGEDEEGADASVREIAASLEAKGRKPYVIPLAPGHPPYGALGYMVAAQEIQAQMVEMGLSIDHFVVASGSGHTHGGLLFGLRALGIQTPVTGICIRRDASQQTPRIIKRCQEIADLLEVDNPVDDADVVLNGNFLAPGYGVPSETTFNAILSAARRESLILDPTYTGKAMAGAMAIAGAAPNGENHLFIHTGGTPSIFAYQTMLTEAAVSSPTAEAAG